MYQLGGLDNLMIEGELPNLPMHIAAALVYEPGPDTGGGGLYHRLLELLDGVIQQMPLLRCRIEELPWHLDKAWWVEDKHFELTRHVVRVALPAPGNWQEFYRLFGHFLAQPLAHDQPLWQLMLVEQLDELEGIPAGSFALCWKIHHAMVDGKSAMRLLRAMHSAPDDVEAAAEAPPRRGKPPYTDYREPPWWLKYSRAWWHSIERPLDLAADLARMMPSMLWGGDGKKDAKTPPVPHARFNGPVAGDRVVGHVRIELAALQALERQHDCTINDLALCIVGGALRQYLLHHDQLPVDSLVAAMPIDVRRPDTDGDIGTRVVVARVPLYTTTRDIRQRLAGIMAATARGKSLHRKDKAHGPKVLDIVDDIHPAAILWLGEWLAGSGLLERMPTLVNTVVTNVPGFPEPAFLLGARLLDYLGFGPLAPGVGLFHTVSSTDEVVNISFVSCRKFIGDGAEYRQALAESSAELLAKLV